MPLRRLVSFMGLFAFTLASPAFAQQATKEWQSGFETGFPGEFLDYDDGSWSASGDPISGKAEAWTIVDESDPLVMWGNHAYKGFPTGPTSESVHRAYPVVYLDVPSPAVNSFMTYIDADFSQVSASEWIHLATYANNPDWVVFTMSVRDKKLEMAHLDWDYVGPAPQPDFPLRKWVRMTTYMEFNGSSTLVEVWQDGVHIFEGHFTDDNGTTLQRVHWGWYSSAGWTEGVEYDDEIQVWSLSDKITDFTDEPESPYGTPSGGTGGGGGTGGTGNATGGGGGVDESGGADNSAGGTTATGGRASAGSSGQSRGGGAGRGNAGASSAGTATSGGASNTMGGTGASSSSGSAGRGSAGRSGGGQSNGGASAGTSGSGTAPAAPSADDDSGCGCRTAPHDSSSLGWLALGALGLASFAKRRSLRRARRGERAKQAG